MTRRRRRAFHDVASYPEIAALASYWRTIAEEARTALDMVGDRLGHPREHSWILPVVPEPEDRSLVPDAVTREARTLAPQTVALAEAIPWVVGFAFSKLAPGKHVAPHYHAVPNLNALLCLDDGGRGSYLNVDGHRHDFVEGEFVIFDYTLEHEARNVGPRDRLALIVIFDPRQRSLGLAAEVDHPDNNPRE